MKTYKRTELASRILRYERSSVAVSYWQNRITPHYSQHVEMCISLALDARNGILGHFLVSVGSVNETLAGPREVFRGAIVAGSTSLVLLHSHVSGDPNPSVDDRHTTNILADAGNMLGIRLLDHVIIGVPTYTHFSFRDQGIL